MYGNSTCTKGSVCTGTVPVQRVVYVREQYKEHLRVQTVKAVPNRIADCEDDVKTKINISINI